MSTKTTKKKTATKAAKKPVKKTAVKKAVRKPAKKVVAKKTVAKKAARKPLKKTVKKTMPKKTIKASKPKARKATPKAAPKAANQSAKATQQKAKTMTNNPFQFDQFFKNDFTNQFTQDSGNQGREGVEAFVKSGTIFTKGFEEFVQTAANLAQNAVEQQTEFTQALLGVKTVDEYARAQNEIAQASFDQFVKNSTQLSEMGVKVLSEAVEPINEQFAQALKKTTGAMAA